jgi:hypothetical protein
LVVYCFGYVTYVKYVHRLAISASIGFHDSRSARHHNSTRQHASAFSILLQLSSASILAACDDLLASGSDGQMLSKPIIATDGGSMADNQFRNHCCGHQRAITRDVLLFLTCILSINVFHVGPHALCRIEPTRSRGV